MILLIAAMKFQQLNSIFAEFDLFVVELRRERLSEVTAKKFAFLSFRERRVDRFGRRRWSIQALA